MTGPRAEAYGRVMATLEEIGPTKLQPAEADRIRESADTLLFAEDGHDDASLLALLELVGLTDHLQDSGRWTAERTARLNADVRACGPQPAADELPRAA
jgi:hypothetical protein